MLKTFIHIFIATASAEPNSVEQNEIPKSPLFQWRQHLPTEKNVALAEYGSPLIVGENIYVGAIMENGLLVFERYSGVIKGRIASNAPVQAKPVLLDNQLIVADKAGNVFRYDLTAENTVWSKSTGAPIVSSPVIDNGLVYVSTVDDVVYCLSLKDGELKWRYAHKADPSRKGKLTILAAPSTTVSNGIAYAGFSDGAIVSLNAATGDAIQATWLGEGRYPDIAASVSVANEMVFASGFEKPFAALKLDLSATLWTKEIGASSKALIQNKRVFHPGVDGVLRVYDVNTGDELWAWDSNHRAALSEPIPIQGAILTGSSASGMTLLDSNSGRVIWQTPSDIPLSGIVGQPEFSENQIVALSSSGNLYAFEFPNPQPTNLGCPTLFCEWNSNE